MMVPQKVQLAESDLQFIEAAYEALSFKSKSEYMRVAIQERIRADRRRLRELRRQQAMLAYSGDVDVAFEELECRRFPRAGRTASLFQSFATVDSHAFSTPRRSVTAKARAKATTETKIPTKLGVHAPKLGPPSSSRKTSATMQQPMAATVQQSPRDGKKARPNSARRG